ncbi:unnamed protein product [Phyllotreta striolata]|uniref:Uncharacterized protein n=1 Tax=Phyllotreta striolata TaxID=444603 RepID=A0A9N9TSH7_PHYSR|nr:unnamed protein product [Phyllotreta striolata]
MLCIIPITNKIELQLIVVKCSSAKIYRQQLCQMHRFFGFYNINTNSCDCDIKPLQCCS